MDVKDIMTEEVVKVNQDTTVEKAANLLVENKISSLPVVDYRNHVVGTISEKDLLYREIDPSIPAAVEYLGGIIFLDGVDKYQEELRKLTATKVEQMMNTNVITIHEGDDIREAARILAHEDVDSVPVVRDGKLVGMISSRDIIKTLIQ